MTEKDPNTRNNVSLEPYESATVRQEGESYIRFFGRKLIAKKNLDTLILDGHKNEFNRNLNAFHLTCIGVGCIIGSGIFVYSGLVAAQNAGPAVVVSFIIAGFVAGLSALCYSEIASMIPVAGSAYSYTYTTMGEFIAWLVGWVLILEYMVGCSAVAVGWSGYLMKFFEDAFGIVLSPVLIDSFLSWSEATNSFNLTGNYFNLPAFIIVTLLSIMLMLGTKESATMTAVVVSVKVVIILIFIFGAAGDVNPGNWVPFLPPPAGDYYGHFGIGGVFKGASVVFFCYTGFDSISTTALESKNFKRDLPISIISSLVISTILYIFVSLIMVGIAPYTILNVPQPITIAIEHINKRWLGIIVGAGAVFGMTTTMIVSMMAQSRIFYSMARDGLMPSFFGGVHPRFKTPFKAQFVVGILASIIAALFPVDVLGELTGMGTLFGFCLVCLGTMILRVKRPDLPRGFKVPFGPYAIPLLGALTSTGLIFSSSYSALLRLLVWILIGVVIYLCYGFRNSRINHPEKWIDKTTATSIVITEH